MYFLRASGSGYASMPAIDPGYDYGRTVEGNLNDSYGPWSDPELQRVPHRFGRRTQFNQRRRRNFLQQY